MQRRYRKCGLSSLQTRNQTHVFTSTVAHIQLQRFPPFFSLFLLLMQTRNQTYVLTSVQHISNYTDIFPFLDAIASPGS